MLNKLLFLVGCGFAMLMISYIYDSAIRGQIDKEKNNNNVDDKQSAVEKKSILNASMSLCMWNPIESDFYIYYS